MTKSLKNSGDFKKTGKNINSFVNGNNKTQINSVNDLNGYTIQKNGQNYFNDYFVNVVISVMNVQQDVSPHFWNLFYFKLHFLHSCNIHRSL